MIGLVILVAWARAATLEIDPAASALRVYATSSLHAFEIEARTLSGRVDPARRDGAIVVPVAALTTGLGPRDARMRTWCLDERAFPEIRYDVDTIEGGDPGAGTGAGDATLRGRLRIRDTARALEIPVTWSWEGGRLRVRGRAPLRWADWGVPDPAVLLSTMGPEVVVTFDVVAAAPAPSTAVAAAGTAPPTRARTAPAATKKAARRPRAPRRGR